MASPLTFTQLNQLYLAYFGRPVDFNGYVYYTTNNATVSDVAAAFASSAESQALYGTGTVASQVNAIYQNLFNRPAELAGLTYWTQQITAGVISAPQAALQILLGAQGTDATCISNKLAASSAFFTDLDTTAEVLGYSGSAAASSARAWLATVTSDPSTLPTAPATATAVANAVAAGVASQGQVFTLTTGVDTFIASSQAGNIFNATLDNNNGTPDATATLGGADIITGFGPVNILNLTDADANAVDTIPAGANISGIQTVNLRTAGNAGSFWGGPQFDVSGITGVQSLSVTSSGTNGDNVNAAGTTSITVVSNGSDNPVETTGGSNVTVTNTGSINISGAKGAVVVNNNAKGAWDYVTVNGGTSVTVNETGAASITVGNAKAPTGAITVTDTGLTTGYIWLNGGTSVSVSDTTTLATGTSGTGNGQIVIGNVTAPTGAVTIVENVTGDKTGNTTAGNIQVKGGTSVTVTSSATQPLATPSTTPGATTPSYTLQQAAVAVLGTSATSSVVVTENAAVAKVDAVTAKAGVNETDVFTFSSLAPGGAVTIGGVTFTNTSATVTLTAAQVAAAFANLTSGAMQGNSTLGAYSAVAGGFTNNWSTGAVSATNTVTATNSKAVDAAGPTLGSAGVTETVGTAGVAAVSAKAGVGGISTGAMSVTDATAGSGTGTINYVQLSGYNTATIASDALATLSLANGTGAVVVTDKGATTLALSLNNVTGSLDLDSATTAKTYKALNITTAAADSTDSITAAAVTALTVAGTNAVDLSGSTFTALKTVTVSGAAGVTMDASGANVTDVNASATTGNMTVIVDASKATYEGGSGNDNVTVTGNVGHAISLGAGNNTLTLSSATAAVTAAVNGGSGSADTLVMDSGLAATDSGSTTFAASVTGFEHLTLTGATAAPSVDVAKLGNFTYVTDASSGADSLTVMNLGSGGTLVLSGANGNVAHTDTVDASAASTASNSLNVVLSFAGATNAGDTVTTGANANVTTVNITATDTTAGVKAGSTIDTLGLTDAQATTITVTGNAHLNLNSANQSVSLVDASGMTGGLTYQAAGVVAETVKGGAAANLLMASSGTVGDTLIGGASADTLVANAGMDTLTGGAGRDTFAILTPSTNLNTYATITDATVGDTIKFVAGAADTFTQSKLVLGATAVFQDYANAIVHTVATTQGAIAWFQFGGDTYIIQHESAVVAESAFTNGVDLVVKLTGAVDLSHTSINPTNGTLLIG